MSHSDRSIDDMNLMMDVHVLRFCVTAFTLTFPLISHSVYFTYLRAIIN